MKSVRFGGCPDSFYVCVCVCVHAPGIPYIMRTECPQMYSNTSTFWPCGEILGPHEEISLYIYRIKDI